MIDQASTEWYYPPYNKGYSNKQKKYDPIDLSAQQNEWEKCVLI